MPSCPSWINRFFERGAPTDYYTGAEAEAAVEMAGEIIASVRIVSVDEARIREALVRYSEDLKKKAEVEAIYLCGS